MYNKLFAQILDSSVWNLPDPTRLVFITLMAAKDETGFARFGTIKNLADRAKVSLEACAMAVETLESPEPETATPDDDGRRIERVPGGWIVIKGPIYDEIANREQEKERVRKAVAAHRARKKGLDVTECNGMKRDVIESNGSDADADAAPPTPRSRGNGESERKAAEATPEIRQADAELAIMEPLGAIWGRKPNEWNATDFSLAREIPHILTPENIRLLGRYVPTREPRYRGTLSGFLKDPEKWLDRARAHFPPKRPAPVKVVVVAPAEIPLTDEEREQCQRDLQKIRGYASTKTPNKDA